MLFTNRLLDPHLRRSLGRTLPRAAVALALLGAPASCSDEAPSDSRDLPDAAPPPPGQDASHEEDASSDAGPDARRLTVECSVEPCARDLSASWSESFCALLDDGRVACWGRNEAGHLGRDAGAWSATAQPVDGVAGAIALDRTCAVVSDGGVRCWGPAAALSGEEGGVIRVPLPPASAVRSSEDLACAVVSGGSLSCWGRSGADGVLAFADAGAEGALVPPTTVPLDGPVDDVAIAVGRRAACSDCPVLSINAVIARFADGTMVSWGHAPLLGRTTSRLPDPEPTAMPTRGGSLFGGFGACAVVDGKMRCWGHRPDDPGDPQPVPGVPSPAQAALGDFLYGRDADRFGRGCAATAAGDVFCWGQNDFGQAGDGTTVLRPEPVKVEGLPERVVRVEVTRGTSCALGVSGRVHCWGDDGFGQRGQGSPFTPDLRPLPVELP